MNTFLKFMRTTIAGGVLFLVPLVIMWTVVHKALDIMRNVTQPLDARLNRELFLGLDGHVIVGVLLLLIVCFIAGLAFRFSVVKSSVRKVESGFLSYIPGYILIKSLATDAFGRAEDSLLKPMLLKEDDNYRPGYLVEAGKDLSTIFLPDAPNANGGEVRIVPTSTIIPVNTTITAVKRSLGNFGKGALEWIPKDLHKH